MNISQLIRAVLANKTTGKVKVLFKFQSIKCLDEDLDNKENTVVIFTKNSNSSALSDCIIQSNWDTKSSSEGSANDFVALLTAMMNNEHAKSFKILLQTRKNDFENENPYAKELESFIENTARTNLQADVEQTLAKATQLQDALQNIKSGITAYSSPTDVKQLEDDYKNAVKNVINDLSCIIYTNQA